MKAVLSLSLCFLLVAVLTVTVASADDDCPKICPLLLDQYCAEDAAGNKQTFNNDCLLRTANCLDKSRSFKVVSAGAC